MFWCSDVRVTYLEQFCKVRRMVLSFKYQNDFKTPEVIPQQVNILKSVLNFQKFQSLDSLNQNIKTNLDYCLIIHIFFTRSLFPKSKAFQNFANCRQFFLQILLNRHFFLLYAEASLERGIVIFNIFYRATVGFLHPHSFCRFCIKIISF